MHLKGCGVLSSDQSVVFYDLNTTDNADYILQDISCLCRDSGDMNSGLFTRGEPPASIWSNSSCEFDNNTAWISGSETSLMNAFPAPLHSSTPMRAHEWDNGLQYCPTYDTSHQFWYQDNSANSNFSSMTSESSGYLTSTSLSSLYTPNLIPTSENPEKNQNNSGKTL